MPDEDVTLNIGAQVQGGPTDPAAVEQARLDSLVNGTRFSRGGTTMTVAPGGATVDPNQVLTGPGGPATMASNAFDVYNSQPKTVPLPPAASDPGPFETAKLLERDVLTDLNNRYSATGRFAEIGSSADYHSDRLSVLQSAGLARPPAPPQPSDEPFSAAENERFIRSSLTSSVNDYYAREGRFDEIGKSAGYKSYLANYFQDAGISAPSEHLIAEALSQKQLVNSLVIQQVAGESLRVAGGIESAYSPAISGSATVPGQSLEQSVTGGAQGGLALSGALIGFGLGGPVGAGVGFGIGSGVGGLLKTGLDDYSAGRIFAPEAAGQIAGAGRGGSAEVQEFTEAIKGATSAVKDLANITPTLSRMGTLDPNFSTFYDKVQPSLGIATNQVIADSDRFFSSTPGFLAQQQLFGKGQTSGYQLEGAAQVALSKGDYAAYNSLTALANANDSRYGTKQFGDDDNKYAAARDNTQANISLFQAQSSVASGTLGLSLLQGGGSADITRLSVDADQKDTYAGESLQNLIIQETARRTRFAKDPAAARYFDTEIAGLQSQQVGLQSAIAGRRRLAFTTGAEEERTNFGLAVTNAEYGGADASTVAGLAGRQADYLANLRGPLSPAQITQNQTEAATLRFQGQQSIYAQTLAGIDVGASSAGVDVARATTSGGPSDVFSARGEQLGALNSKLAELSNEIQRGVLTADQRLQKEREYNDTLSQGVQLAAGRIQERAQAELGIADTNASTASVGISRTLAIGGNAAFPNAVFDTQNAALSAANQLLSVARTPEQVATARNAVASAQNNLAVSGQIAQTYSPDAATRTRLDSDRTAFEVSQILPFTDGSGGSNPFTRGLAYEGDLRGLERQYRSAAASATDPLAREADTAQANALKLQVAGLDRQRLTEGFRALPEFIAGSPGAGVLAAAVPTAALSSLFSPNPYVSGGFGAAGMSGGVHSPITQREGGAAGIANQGLGVNTSEMLLRAILSAIERGNRSGGDSRNTYTPGNTGQAPGLAAQNQNLQLRR